MRRYHFWLVAICIAGILLAIGLVIRSISQRPLSPLETQMVGHWADNHGNATHSFWPDRSFSTSDGQFEGRWSIDGNRLTLEYWQAFRLRDVNSVDDFRSKLRASGKRDTVAWEIEFGDDGQTHTLIFSEDDVRDPGGKWKFTRRPDQQ